MKKYICASILAADLHNLREEIDSVAEADIIHLIIGVSILISKKLKSISYNYLKNKEDPTWQTAMNRY